jgi:hypothetical protein
VAGEAEVEIGIVSQERGIGAISFDISDERPELAIDTGQMGHNFRESNDGKTPGINDWLYTASLKSGPCTSEK